MRRRDLIISTLLLSLLCPLAHARDRIKLKTTVIKGNKEMPEIIYIVPWKSLDHRNDKSQTLVLHSLFGDLFDPVHMDATRQSKSLKPISEKRK